MGRVSLLIVVAGCATPYVAGQIEREDYAKAYQFGCVEIGVRPAVRAEAHGPVIVVYLGNRCDHSVAIDLRKLSVVGGNERGTTTPMVLYDPDREIESVPINGRASGEEWIELSAATPISDLAWLEVDIGSVVPEVPATKTTLRLVIPRST
jgi:hypothetical protein